MGNYGCVCTTEVDADDLISSWNIDFIVTVGDYVYGFDPIDDFVWGKVHFFMIDSIPNQSDSIVKTFNQTFRQKFKVIRSYCDNSGNQLLVDIT